MTQRQPTIRHAILDDYKQIAKLIYQSHTVSFVPFASSEWVGSRERSEYEARWRRKLSEHSSDRITLVAEHHGTIVGTVSVSPMDSPEYDAQLHGMHVAPNQTGQGTGGSLMAEAIRVIEKQRYRRVQLGVIAANRGARRFYEAHGWELAQELPGGIEGVPIVIYSLEHMN